MLRDIDEKLGKPYINQQQPRWIAVEIQAAINRQPEAVFLRQLDKKKEEVSYKEMEKKSLDLRDFISGRNNIQVSISTWHN